MSFGRVFLSVLLSSLSAVFLCSCSKPPEKVEIVKPVRTVKVEGGKVTGRISYPAKVQAARRVDLAFENVDGRVVELKVKPGDRVKKGEALAKIDPTNYKSELKLAQAMLDEAKSDFERYKKLVKSGAVAVADFEKRKRDYEMAMSKYRIAKKNLDDTNLRAPFAGMIGAKYIDENQNVRAKQKIFQLQNDSEIEIAINIPEQDMARSHRAEDRDKAAARLKPMVSFPTNPDKKYPLSIKEFQTVADPVTQTFKVTFKMPRPKGIIVTSGMTANVSLEKSYFQGEKAGYQIPFTAVFVDDKGDKCVWKVGKDMKVHSAKVAVGSVSGGDAIITSGVENGDVVVTAGVHSLSEGMKVRLSSENY
jgi:RND family efflux transporter MFP subunit